VNHGFNQGGPLSDETQRQYRRNMYLAFVDEFAQANPNAGVVLIGQPPDGRVGREEWQAQKAVEFAKVAAWRGWGFINVHRKWIEYGNWQADLTLGDQVHPTAAGLALWADTLQTAMRSAARVPTTTQPALGGASSQVFKNPQLSAWGGVLPEGVTSAPNCTVTKELVDFETGVQAMKLTSTAVSGFAYVELTGTAEQWGIKGRLANNTYTVAVRLKVPAANTNTVRVALLDNNGPTYTMATDVPASPAARDRYIWVYATKAFPANATTLTMWIVARTSGTAIVEVLVDEIRITPGPSAQPGISARDTLGALAAVDGDFAQRVDGAWVPRTPAQVAEAVVALDLRNLATLLTGLGTTATRFLYYNEASDSWGTQATTSFGRGLSALADAAALRVAAAITTIGSSIVTAVDAPAARTALGIAYPYDMHIPVFIKGSTRALGTGEFPQGIKLRRAITVQSISVRGDTAGASGNLVVELQKNGVTIAASATAVTLSNAQQSAAGGGNTVTGLTVAFAAGDVLTATVTTLDTTPGKGLFVDIGAVTA
jgi:hypothetical protein